MTETPARYGYEPPACNPARIVVGLTGASGAVYARRLVEVLLAGGHRVDLVPSRAGAEVAAYELGEGPDTWRALAGAPERLAIWGERDFTAPFCSGSAHHDGMAVVPCSMGTLARIAAGTAETLLLRAADVCLKERRRLVLVARETPLSLIHIENMARATRAGAVVLPAAPGFYQRPERIEDLVDFVVGRTLSALGIGHRLLPAWGEGEGDLE